MDDREFDQPEFLARLRAGEEAAYRRLVRRFHAALVGVAAGIIGSRAQAEEVVQEAKDGPARIIPTIPRMPMCNCIPSIQRWIRATTDLTTAIP